MPSAQTSLALNNTHSRQKSGGGAACKHVIVLRRMVSWLLHGGGAEPYSTVITKFFGCHTIVA